ncbi:hypothetical protein [Undibacterium sp. TC9W]|uniref:hypothetical protein n=1 Tax=Undibacterium sp. TC9W TaxID=3413053 RepID=UPI003BF3F6AD
MKRLFDSLVRSKGTRFLLSTVLLISMCISTPITYATDTVTITDHVDCSDHYSALCGWPDGPIYIPGDSGGGNGGGGGSGAAGDGSTGKSENNNRPPQCLREQLYLQEIASKIAQTGVAEGTFLSIPISDPNFPDGQWFKYEATSIQSYWTQGDADTTRLKIVVHYMFNVATKEVFQMKIKTSYESGCVGIKK